MQFDELYNVLFLTLMYIIFKIFAWSFDSQHYEKFSTGNMHFMCLYELFLFLTYVAIVIEAQKMQK